MKTTTNARPILSVLPNPMTRNHRKLIVPNDSKLLQIGRLSAMLLKYDDINKCAVRFQASFKPND